MPLRQKDCAAELWGEHYRRCLPGFPLEFTERHKDKSKTAIEMSSCHDRFMELRLKPERLHPDLEAYLRDGPLGGLCLDHPLVQELSIDPEHAARTNYKYMQNAPTLMKRKGNAFGSAMCFCMSGRIVSARYRKSWIVTFRARELTGN